MIDIHTHILPGLDDGAQTLADALRMARMALDDGIRQVVATPHVQWMIGNGCDRILEKVEMVRAALAQEGLELTVYSGAELYLEPAIVSQLQNRTALTINGGRYALIELPILDYPSYADQLIFELQVAGYTPVLAHPERVGAFLRDPRPLYRLAQRGILMQVTAESLLGGFGQQVKALTETLLDHNVAHVIASDSHSIAHRPPALRAAAERAARIVGTEGAWAMVTSVPQAILDDRPVNLPEPRAYQAPKMWDKWR